MGRSDSNIINFILKRDTPEEYTEIVRVYPIFHAICQEVDFIHKRIYSPKLVLIRKPTVLASPRISSEVSSRTKILLDSPLYNSILESHTYTLTFEYTWKRGFGERSANTLRVISKGSQTIPTATINIYTAAVLLACYIRPPYMLIHSREI